MTCFVAQENDYEKYERGKFLLEEGEDVNYCEHSFSVDGEGLTNKEVIDLLYDINAEREQLQKELNFIQSTISDEIKHQKTEIGKKALKKIIAKYNDYLLGHERE